MDKIAVIRQELGERWIPEIYLNNVRPLRTRSFEMDISERENTTEIFETLLGWELRVGNRRFACPTLETARYLQIFARLGCRNFAVPYDITAIPPLTELLESAWLETERSMSLHLSGGSPQMNGKQRARLIRAMREEIAKAGAGELMPLFNKSTKQRNDQ